MRFPRRTVSRARSFRQAYGAPKVKPVCVGYTLDKEAFVATKLEL